MISRRRFLAGLAAGGVAVALAPAVRLAEVPDVAPVVADVLPAAAYTNQTARYVLEAAINGRLLLAMMVGPNEAKWLHPDGVWVEPDEEIVSEGIGHYLVREPNHRGFTAYYTGSNLGDYVLQYE